MANILKCDRCGKEYRYKFFQTFSIARRRWYDKDNFWRSKSYDLCLDCAREFERDFMHMKPDVPHEDDIP